MDYRLLICLVISLFLADGNARSKTDAHRESLSRLQSYVGQWRGVGQVRRGSTIGAWSEQAACAWDLTSKQVSLELNSPKAKYFSSMRFMATDKSGNYKMAGQRESERVTYSGSLDDSGSLTLRIDKASPGAPDRLKLRLVAKGKRLLVLYEKKIAETRYTRLGEVGFTRKGSGFGSGISYVECVVTGGEGTIPVKFEGKTYYVCCTGCKEYFDDDPAKAMAEYHERVAERKAKAAKKVTPQPRSLAQFARWTNAIPSRPAMRLSTEILAISSRV